MKNMNRVLLFVMMFFLCVNSRAQEATGDRVDALLASMKDHDKAALLMVHFGTTYDDTRAKTIDVINEKARKTFPRLEVRESYSSRIIIRRLKTRGIIKDTPLQAMMRLYAEGYTHLIVQSTNIIEGKEMNQLRQEMESMRPFFKEIRLGNPLLYSVEDAQQVVDILSKHLTVNTKKREHVLLVGHGTDTPATAIYSEIDYLLKAAGLSNYHVGTIEGYPTFETALQQIQQQKGKTVVLMPFMFVAGDHARNDISVDWKKQLEEAGLQVELHIVGLGELPEIQDIFLEHARGM